MFEGVTGSFRLGTVGHGGQLSDRHDRNRTLAAPQVVRLLHQRDRPLEFLNLPHSVWTTPSSGDDRSDPT